MSVFKFVALVDNQYQQGFITHFVFAKDIDSAQKHFKEYLSKNNMSLMRIDDCVCINPYDGNIVMTNFNG